MEISKIGEVDLIARIQRRFFENNNQLEVGIGDDSAAVQTEPDKLLLITTDMLVEGNHFLRGSISYKDLGYKSLAVNFSDIAAMGGVPRHAVISLALPPDLQIEEFDNFYDGIQEMASIYSVAVVGGDITSSSLGMVINITVTGQVDKERVLLQSGAKAGDLIAVTGNLGGSEAGLAVLLNPDVSFPSSVQEKALERHFRPMPRVKEGLTFSSTGKIHAMKDISDGLAKEINTIANSSGVKAVLDAARIPISPFASEICQILDKNPLEMAVQGGEEYELIFTFATRDYEMLSDIASKNNFALHVIGSIETGEGVFIKIGKKNEPLFFKGYEHF